MVGYKFSDILPNIDVGYACFSSYSTIYREDKNYFVGIACFDLVEKFLDFVKENVENFSIDLVKKDKCYDNKEIYFFKITVSNKYNKLSKYIVTYMCGVFLNQFSSFENFIKGENPDKCDWKFLAEINNKRRGNTNHTIYSPGRYDYSNYSESKLINYIDLKPEWLEKLDDIEFCNEVAFKEDFDEVGSGEYSSRIGFGLRPKQTPIINRIRNCLGE